MHLPFSRGLIVDAVKTDNALKEDMQLGMRRRVFRHLEQGLENICSRVNLI